MGGGCEVCCVELLYIDIYFIKYISSWSVFPFNSIYVKVRDEMIAQNNDVSLAKHKTLSTLPTYSLYLSNQPKTTEKAVWV